MMVMNFYHSRKYDVRIVDRVGGGDSFAGGLICGLLDGKNMKDALEFARGSFCTETYYSWRF